MPENLRLWKMFLSNDGRPQAVRRDALRLSIPDQIWRIWDKQRAVVMGRSTSRSFENKIAALCEDTYEEKAHRAVRWEEYPNTPVGLSLLSRKGQTWEWNWLDFPPEDKG